jgi:hypothetical protein
MPTLTRRRPKSALRLPAYLPVDHGHTDFVHNDRGQEQSSQSVSLRLRRLGRRAVLLVTGNPQCGRQEDHGDAICCGCEGAHCLDNSRQSPRNTSSG